MEIHLNIDSLGIKITIRPIGIDAPETRKTPKEEKQCYGKRQLII